MKTGRTIGYTTISVNQRMNDTIKWYHSYAQNGVIKNHNINEHNSRISTNDIIDQIQIFFSATDKTDPQIAEALLIHMKKTNTYANICTYIILHIFSYIYIFKKYVSNIHIYIYYLNC